METLPTYQKMLSLAGAGVSAYHGYKRDKGSIGWTLVWAALGGLAPITTVAVALAQGYAKPKAE